MSRRLPCPNPACTQVFDLATLTGADNLVCPRCGTRFQFRAKPAATPMAPFYPELARDLPTAQPIESDVPDVAPVEDEADPDDLAFAPASAVVRPTLPRRRTTRASNRGPMLVIVSAFAVFVGLASGCLVWYYSSSDISDESNPMPAQSNCRFKLPGGAWKPDDEAKVGLNVNFALRRNRPSSLAGLFYRDYKTRLPRDDEMREEALSKIRAYFKPLEWQPKPKSDTDVLGGQPAFVLEFQGRDPDQVEMSGECHATAFRGIGYWFFTWGPADDRDQISPEWETLRQGFTLLNQREGWKEVAPETEPVEGSDVPYRLNAVKGVWKKVKKEGYDPKADVVLLGRSPVGPKHASTDATVQVLLLPKVDDLQGATKAARDHYLERQKEGEGYPETTIAVYEDQNGVAADRDTDVGAAPGHITKLHVVNAENRERYVVLAVVDGHPGGVVVLVCDCDWRQREMWEPEFAVLLKSFRFKE